MNGRVGSVGVGKQLHVDQHAWAQLLAMPTAARRAVAKEIERVARSGLGRRRSQVIAVGNRKISLEQDGVALRVRQVSQRAVQRRERRAVKVSILRAA